MRRETDADVQGRIEMETDGYTDLVKRLAMIGNEHGEDVGPFFETDTLGDVYKRQSGSRAYQLEDRAVTGGQGFPEGRAQHS